MIFADKVMQLRKRAGWTQEELAEQMDVSRQSVAKWEGAQSIPELNKLLRLSELFGVSMDYLLKDEVEELPQGVVEGAGASADTCAGAGSNGTAGFDAEPAPRRVTLAEAHEFLRDRRSAATPLATGVMLCVLSPVCLFLLSFLSEHPAYGVTENLATGAGMCALLVLVAIAVALFVVVGNKNAHYVYLETQPIDTEYGVNSVVRECRAAFKPVYDRCNLAGVLLCVLSAALIFVGIMVDGGDLFIGMMLCTMLVTVAVGVFLFVRVGVVWASFEKLLQDGNYTCESKRTRRGAVGVFPAVYWIAVTALYLGLSFMTTRWDRTWIVWAVAGVLFPAANLLVHAAAKRQARTPH